MIRYGKGEPVVLFHGVTGSETMWRNVIPRLAPFYDTIALTALGHRGGHPGRPGASVQDLVDDAERSLDELGLERPHLAGNSLGGWMAIELARRGRAASVCALSPAGFWDTAAGEHLDGARKLRRAVGLARRTRKVMPWAARLALVRRIALHDNAVHGERVTRGDLLEVIDDVLACTLCDELLSTEEQIAPLDPLPCPIVLAWSGRDRILPPGTSGARARLLLPQATWKLIPDVGHAPMFDDPQLVAQTIYESIEESKAGIQVPDDLGDTPSRLRA
jgi:pimeloyl-ACP methyl ester carboxylesterase